MLQIRHRSPRRKGESAARSGKRGRTRQANEAYRELVDEEVERLNDEWAIVCHGNDVFICSEQRCPQTKRLVWHIYHQNGFLLAETSWAVNLWLKSSKHNIYPRSFVFDPSTTDYPEGAINLWRGWAVVPKPGDWSLVREHIHKVLAAGNKEHADYIIKWLAWMFQNPDRRAEVALVFRGKKGSGRGTLGRPTRMLCGQHGMQIYSAKLLTGDFNNHLRDCVFLFADEAMWAGDKSADGKLKGMITEDSLPIEGKGKDAISVPNCLHIMMASNNDWVVPATADEPKLNDEAYTKRYVPAMLYDLLHMKLDGWHPRWNIPQTEALHA